ncbi:MAG: hypothetical protein ACLGGX_11615 [Bdellovibrionia bacterium]
MSKFKLLIVALSLVPQFVLANTVEYRIFSTKKITPNVERFYGKDNIAFATQFCSQNAAQVMFVDSRVPSLGGVNFYYSSLDECQAATREAAEEHKRCTVVLSLDVSTKKAQMLLGNCN